MMRYEETNVVDLGTSFLGASQVWGGLVPKDVAKSRKSKHSSHTATKPGLLPTFGSQMTKTDDTEVYTARDAIVASGSYLPQLPNPNPNFRSCLGFTPTR